MQIQAATLTEARKPLINETLEINPLDQINEGCASMLTGNVARGVIAF